MKRTRKAKAGKPMVFKYVDAEGANDEGVLMIRFVLSGSIPALNLVEITSFAQRILFNVADNVRLTLHVPKETTLEI